jgi:hypothetical protein
MLTRRRFFQAALAAGLGSLVPAIGGCTPTSSARKIRDALAALRAQRIAPQPLAGLQDFRGVVHAHTALSHDSTGTDGQILEAAHLAKLDFLVTTDHYTPRIFTEGLDGVHEYVLVVRGVELPLGCVRGEGIDRRCGSVLAIGLREPLDPDRYARKEDLLTAIRAQGALAIIAHARGVPDPRYFDLADGIEVYDIADTIRERLVELPRYLLATPFLKGEFETELFLPIVERSNWSLVQWDRLTQTRRFVGLAGNDAHQNLSLLGRQIDPYSLIFRSLNTHVLVPLATKENRFLASPSPSDKLVTALRAGRCFASFNLLADAAGFRYTAHVEETGAMVAVMGDEASLEDGILLIAQSPIPGAIVLLRDGVPIRRQAGRELRYRVDRTGVYRIEVSLWVVDRWRPWILANPIYVRA